jgi:hypothetical protein
MRFKSRFAKGESRACRRTKTKFKSRLEKKVKIDHVEE